MTVVFILIFALSVWACALVFALGLCRAAAKPYVERDS
jgi:hypothetical protein